MTASIHQIWECKDGGKTKFELNMKIDSADFRYSDDELCRILRKCADEIKKYQMEE